jgi:hypothetical protein
MTDKCQFCNGTGKEYGFDGCVWCHSTGTVEGQKLFAAPAAVVAAVTDAAIHGTGVMLLNPAEGAEHVPLADILVNLKPFRSLPYGTRFRYQGTKDAWVRTSHNIVAEWPGRLRTPTNEPIQSLCSFCHLDGDEDGNTLDTLVEVVDQDAELAALRDELAGVVAEKVGLQEWVDNLKHDLTAAEQRNAELEKDAARYIWLRDKSESVHQFYLSTPIWFTGVKFNTENVDSTIDAAMAKPTESGASE